MWMMCVADSISTMRRWLKMTVLHRRKDASPRSSATSEQFPTSRHGSFGYPPKLDGLRILVQVQVGYSNIDGLMFVVPIHPKFIHHNCVLKKASNLTNEARKFLKALEVHNHRG